MNQPPPTEKQMGKRIVSKRRYTALMSKKLSLYFVGATFSVGGMILIGVFSCIIFDKHSALFPLLKLALFVGALTLCFFISEIGKKSVKAAKQITPGVPLTHANVADLPAPDSLIRASEEPRQEPQAVLLRAATGDVERHEEQLVRAAGGTE